MSIDIYNIRTELGGTNMENLSIYQLPEVTRQQIKVMGGYDGMDEAQIIQLAVEELYVKFTNDELIQKWINIKNGKGVYLTQEEFEKQCEVD